MRFALSAEKDRYVKHHRTFGGAAWVWLKSPKDESKVAAALMGLKGVEAVLPRHDAAAKFGLMPERIGELAVFGDAETVFGELDIADGGTGARLSLARFAARIGHPTDYLSTLQWTFPRRRCLRPISTSRVISSREAPGSSEA